MGAIFEKGMMIGFGFIILVSFLSIVNPVMNVLMTDKRDDNLKGIDEIALIFDYSLNYFNSNYDKTISFYVYLENNITIECHRIEEKTKIQFYSPSKLVEIESIKIVEINTFLIYGNITIDFTFYSSYIQIEIEMF